MKDFIGGIDPNVVVNVLENKKTKKKKLSALKPGDFLGQAASDYFFRVNEVRIFKRSLTGYKIKLESGERLIVAKNTVLCGQYGTNLVTEQKNEILCLANMGRFRDRGHSRRNFKVSFEAPPKLENKLKKMFRRSLTGYEKKFYRYSDLLQFLEKFQKRFPAAKVVFGLEIHSHYIKDLYDIKKLKEQDVFFPLFQFATLHDDLMKQFSPALIAFDDGSTSRVESRKIESCEEISSEGPWAFPIFDKHETSYEWPERTRPEHRFSFTANGIPIFYPNNFIDNWAANKTLPKEKELQLPPIPIEDKSENSEPYCWDLDSVYENISDLVKSKQNKAALDATEKAADELFEKFKSLAGDRIKKKQLVKLLETRVLELYRSTTKASRQI